MKKPDLEVIVQPSIHDRIVIVIFMLNFEFLENYGRALSVNKCKNVDIGKYR